MPNWCVTNWTIRGKREDVQAFCDTVNDLPNHPVDKDNFFGTYWLGNLGKQLGLNLDPNKDNYRGTLDVDGQLCATLFFPGSREEKQPLLDAVNTGDIACVSFSTASAWDRPFWLEDYISEHFMDYGFYSTDEFGNFYTVNNTEFYPYVYCVVQEDEGYEEFKYGEEEEIAKHIGALIGEEIAPPANYAELVNTLEAYTDRMVDEGVRLVAYDIERL